MLVSLDKIKTHLNIDLDYTDEDEYLEFLHDAAVQMIEKSIDKSFQEILDEEGEIPKLLLHAILLIIANFYANRESVSYANSVEIPKSLTYILQLFRDYKNANI